MQTSIPSLRPAALAAAISLLAAGCATSDVPPPKPFRSSEVEAFLKPVRDPREMGITILIDPAFGKPRFEGANRPHMERTDEFPMLKPCYPCPFLDLKTPTDVNFRVLVDTSARQSWLLPAACNALSYRPVKPPLGEYPDHVDSPVPGYAGIANKIVARNIHVEAPVFYVPMASGHLGPLARPDADSPSPDAAPLPEKARRARAKFRASVHAVLGAEMLGKFTWVRLDFPKRRVRLSSSSKPYKPPVPEAVAARLPMLDWRGRPAIDVRLDGKPVRAVVDTAGDFELSVPAPAAPTGRLDLAPSPDLPRFVIPLATHESLGLPADFPPRLGARLLSRYVVTLDYKNRLVWLEDPELAAQRKKDADDEDGDDRPVRYRGIVP